MTANVMKSWRRVSKAEEPEWAVWLLVIVMLALALLVRWIVESRTEQFSENDVSLRYPAGWVRLPTEDAFDMVAVGEPFETALFPTSVRVKRMPITEISTTAQTLGDLAIKWANQQSENETAYRVLSMEPATVGGNEAVRIMYAYVADPHLGGATVPPIVARGEDILIRNGDTVTIATFVANDNVYDSQIPMRDRILGSLQVK